MTIDRNDPRWTAYVLGELDGEERAAFEAELAADPTAEETLEEMRESVAAIEDTFALGAPVQLTEAQRETILAQAPRPAPGRRVSGRWMLAAGLAASVLIGVVTLNVVRDVPDRAGADTFVLPSQQTAEPASEQRPFATPAARDETSGADATQAADGVPGSQLTLQGGLNSAGLPPSPTPTAASLPGALTGTVSDETGARIPGVEVTATDATTRASTKTLTNETGTYRFGAIEGDDITLSAALPGFQTQTYANVRPGNEEQRYDFTLPVGGVATQVEVSVSAPPLTVQSSASVGDVAQAGVGGRSFAAPGYIGPAVRGITAAAPPPPPPPPPAAASPPPTAPEPQVLDAFGETRRTLVDQNRQRFNTEEYARINDNKFLAVSEEPLSTFSIDVDTASYANVRRFLNQRTLPPPDAVRIEEMINYFRYDYAPPVDGRPVRIHTEVSSAPWAPDHRLVRIGIQGEEIERTSQASNLVFLIDVSGSMESPDKLPLLVDGLQLLVQQLGENDRVAIVVYAGASGLVLDSTPGFRRQRIMSALDRLHAGGSTNGGAGIQLAYDVAVRNFVEGGVNRVILATDGDFNIGVTNSGDLTRLIEDRAETGVFLSVLGFGTGNLSDARLEALADRGNGNYSYIDSIREARKVLVEEIGSTLVTIAKDVKIQVEFNPAEVTAYRLIGYENRALENQDFNDDTVDAGEIGSGHTVTALFEIVPAGVGIDLPGVDPLRYQSAAVPSDQARSGELLTVAVRYKAPDGDESRLIEAPLVDEGSRFDQASTDQRFAAAVAGFGMLLRNSPYKGSASFDSVLRIAQASQGVDEGGYREEFLELVRRARALEDLN